MYKENDHKDVWVFAEHRYGELKNVALELIGEGHRISRDKNNESKVCAVLIGNDIRHMVCELYSYGADIVYLIEDKLLENYTTDGYAKVMTDAIRKLKPEIVLFGATHIGRDLAPRIAARLDTGLTADCTRLDIDNQKYIDYLENETTANTEGMSEENGYDGLKQTRPAFGGNLMATIITPKTKPEMATVRPGVMEKLEKKNDRKGELIEIVPELEAGDIGVEVLEIVNSAKKMISLSDADIICAGGRGLGSASGFKLIERFAEKVGGCVGASRAAVDAGWIDQTHQVGQTGTTVKPKIYFACGISGAIQHLAGMQTSDIIISINKDPEAPIMKISDFTLCGDLNKIIPEIIQQWDQK